MVSPKHQTTHKRPAHENKLSLVFFFFGGQVTIGWLHQTVNLDSSERGRFDSYGHHHF